MKKLHKLWNTKVAIYTTNRFDLLCLLGYILPQLYNLLSSLNFKIIKPALVRI